MSFILPPFVLEPLMFLLYKVRLVTIKKKFYTTCGTALFSFANVNKLTFFHCFHPLIHKAPPMNLHDHYSLLPCVNSLTFHFPHVWKSCRNAQTTKSKIY